MSAVAAPKRLTQLHGEPESTPAGPSTPWHSIELGEPAGVSAARSRPGG